MPKRPNFEPIQRGDQWIVSVPPSMTATGERARRVFANSTAATKYARSMRVAYDNGERGNIICPKLANQATEAQSILDGTGTSIVEAARMASDAKRLLDGTGISVMDAVKIAAEKFLTDASRETFGARYARAVASRESSWRPRYLADIKRLPHWLPESFLATPCGTIDRAAMERALLASGPKARSTLDMRIARISAILGFRERHQKGKTIHILTDDQRTALIAACADADERRVVGVLLYAGIRPDAEHGEISRLEWEDFGPDHIVVHPDASKTGTDRLIPITPALRRAIADHPESGPVTPANWKRKWARIRKAAGITVNDITRHTFASHFLAWQGEDATKNALGHTAGSSTLFRHYRRAVTEEAGRAYFD